MRQVDAAWAAGLFEGEGSIVHCPNPKNSPKAMRRRLSMQMNDRDVIERFVAIVGYGEVREVTRRNRVNRENHSTSYCWEINKWSEVERILSALLPFLGERRRDKALALLADPAGPVGRPQNLILDK